MTKLAEPLVGSSRRGITPAIRRAVLGEHEDNDCEYCGQLGTEVDHVIPFSRGGGLDLENLAAACSICNSEKSSYTVKEWAAKRRDHGKPWPIPSLWDRVGELVYRIKLKMTEEEFKAASLRGSWCEELFGSREQMYRLIINLRDIHPLPTSRPIPRHWIDLVEQAPDLKTLRNIWRRASELDDLTADFKAAAKARSQELPA